jgi:hypothetical protein
MATRTPFTNSGSLLLFCVFPFQGKAFRPPSLFSPTNGKHPIMRKVKTAQIKLENKLSIRHNISEKQKPGSFFPPMNSVGLRNTSYCFPSFFPLGLPQNSM